MSSWPSRQWGVRWAPPAALVACLAGALAVGQFGLPPQVIRIPRQRSVSVQGRTLVCPPGPTGLPTLIAAADDSAGAGMLLAGPLAGPARPLRQSPATLGGRPGPGSASIVRASGAPAATLSVSELVTGAGSLALADCLAPGAGPFYFVGAAGTIAAGETLQLSNPDPRPAVANVRVWAAGGPLATPAGLGTQVPPRASVAIPVADLAPGQPLVALAVTTSYGRIAPALLQRQGNSVSYLPAQLAPATELVLPGLPAGSGRRWITVADLGAGDASLSVRLLTPRSSFVPSGLQAVRVTAGRSVQLDLTAALAGAAGVVLLRSSAPVLATAGALTGANLAWLGAAAPLPGPVAVPLWPAVATVLLAYAPDGPAELSMRGAARGSFGIPAGGLIFVHLAAGAGLRQVVLAALAGPVDVGWQAASGRALTLAALHQPAQRVPLLAVTVRPAAAYSK